MGSLSIWHWLIVLAIITMVFGTTKLRTIGTDLGGAIKGFKEGVRDADSGEPATPVLAQGATIDVAAKETAAHR